MRQYAIFMCGEYIKAGWVTYAYRANCDSPAARPRPAVPLTLAGAALLALALALLAPRAR